MVVVTNPVLRKGPVSAARVRVKAAFRFAENAAGTSVLDTKKFVNMRH